MKNIFIINQHSDNRGDQAACRAMIRTLETMVPDAQFTIASFSPQYPLIEGTNIRHLGFNNFAKSNLVQSTLWAFFPRLRGLLARFVSASNLVFLNAYDEADVVVSAPGGPYIGDLYGMEPRFLYYDWLAHVFGKPLVVYAPSMGPFSGRLRNFLRRYVLNKAAIVLVRDPISFDYVHRLKLEVPIFLAADSALQEDFSVFDREAILDLVGIAKDDHGPFVGMTPAELSWHPSRRRNRDAEQLTTNEEIVTILAEIIDWIWIKYKARVVFFPQLFGRQSDMNVIHQVISAAKFGYQALILPSMMDSDDQQRLAGLMSLFVGMRYHSAIFAVKAGVPPVCIAYEHKTVGFMNSIDLNELVISVDELEVSKLKHIIDYAFENQSVIRQRLSVQIHRIRKRAFLSSVAVSTILSLPPNLNCDAKRKIAISTLQSYDSDLCGVMQ